MEGVIFVCDYCYVSYCIYKGDLGTTLFHFLYVQQDRERRLSQDINDIEK